MSFQDKIVIISSFITILAFIFSFVIFLIQRKELINSKKTQELRNEMHAIFALIGHFAEIGNSANTIIIGIAD